MGRVMVVKLPDGDHCRLGGLRRLGHPSIRYPEGVDSQVCWLRC
jgi:hypothetical protein